MRTIQLSQQFVSSLLFPFGRVTPLSKFRLGILTLAEKWSIRGLIVHAGDSADALQIPSNLLADNTLAANIIDNGAVPPGGRLFEHPWQLPALSAEEIRNDFPIITAQQVSAPIPAGVMAFGARDIFIEPGAKIYPGWLNAEEGPIYIGRNVLIMEGVSIRGPVSIGEGSVIKMGARLYGGTSIGRYCTVGGEVKNSVIQDYSNKAHEGYLGDSVIGRWCNLGAGTSNSNLKNTAGNVRVWSEFHQSYLDAGQKAGVYMGDYSRTAINTSINTGTVIGVSCHVAGTGPTPKYLPDFSWGYPEPRRFDFGKAIESITNWKKLKNKTIDVTEIQALKHIFEQSLKN